MKIFLKKAVSFVCVCTISLSIMAGGVFGFNDIASVKASTSAEALSFSGIVNGYPDGTFKPNNTLTRSEFCKIIMAASERPEAVSTYKNYTIFPDVPHTHWASGYINMAVKKSMAISGYPDGTFKPEANITVAEAVTVCLRLLSYKVEDVGIFWPGDYVAKARELGLLDGILADTSGNLSRGDAAIMVHNLMLSQTKDGTQYLKKAAFSSTIEDIMIIGDKSTDSTLNANEIKVATVGVKDSEKIYTCKKAVPQAIIGLKGTLLFDTVGTSGGVNGFIPNKGSIVTIIVDKVEGSAITASDGRTITVGADIPVAIRGSIKSYGDSWFDIVIGSTITLAYDKTGALESISTMTASATQGPYMLDNDGSPGNLLTKYFSYDNNSKIYKNGALTQYINLKKYDVATYDKGANIFYVTNNKLTGAIEDGYPTVASPDRVTILGKTYTVLASAKAQFSSYKLGDMVTLILTADDRVIGVVSASEHRVRNYCYIESVSGLEAKVILLPSGKKETYKMLGVQNDLEGSFATVSTERDGKVSFIRYDNVSTEFKPLNIKNRNLGDRQLGSNVKYYQRANGSRSLVEIDLSKLSYIEQIAATDVYNVIKDDSDNILAVVIEGITGEGYTYGRLDGTRVETEAETRASMSVTNADGTKTGNSLGLYWQPRGIGGLAIRGDKVIAAVALQSLGTVTRKMFDGAGAVTVSGKNIRISPDVAVYIEKTGKFETLDRARALCDEFEIYVNTGVKYNEVVRYILAK